MVTGPDAGLRDRPRDARARRRGRRPRGIPRAAGRGARARAGTSASGSPTFIEASPGPPDYGAALGDERVAPDRAERAVPGSSPTARSRSSPASSRTARATRRRWRSSRPTGCRSTTSRSGWCTATPTSRRSTSSAPAAAGPRRWRAARSSARSPRCANASSTSSPAATRSIPTTSRWSTGSVRVRGVPASAWDLARVGHESRWPRGHLRLRDPRGRLVPGDALLLGRGRRRHRDRPDPALPRRRGLRLDDQPGDRRRAGRGRGGAGDRRASSASASCTTRRASRSRRRCSTTCSRPRARCPTIEIVHLESPPQGPIDFRGVGENGAVGSPAALANAIEDALRPVRRARHRTAPLSEPYPRSHRRRVRGPA